MAQTAVDRITETFELTFPGLVKGYILTCKTEGKSPHTIEFYQSVLHRFVWYAEGHNFPQNPQMINGLHIADFLSYVKTEPVRWGGTSTTARLPVNQTTVRHYYRTLYTFFSWLKEEKFITENPVARIKTPKVCQKVIQALNPSEVQALLDHCLPNTFLGSRNRAIVMMLLDSGMRVSELANLSLNDVDMDTGAILIRHGKGDKQRIVRVGSTAQKALWRYLTLYRKGTSDRLFLTKSREPLQAEAIQLMVRRLGKKAHIHDVHVHKLRHTFAISFLRAGGDIFTLKYLLGHSSLTMVQNYLGSLSAEDAARAHKRYSPVDNLRFK